MIDYEFQFHTGTINPKRILCFTEHKITFQFHTGTINPVISKPLLRILFCFNSTLVRLIPSESSVTYQVMSPFQFHTGTINPLYLWLWLWVFNLFQFHTGTINPHGRPQTLFNHIKFQFHTGTINPTLTKWFCRHKFSVSIPHWYD